MNGVDAASVHGTPQNQDLMRLMMGSRAAGKVRGHAWLHRANNSAVPWHNLRRMLCFRWACQKARVRLSGPPREGLKEELCSARTRKANAEDLCGRVVVGSLPARDVR
jgi:hypothetical protein